MTEAVDSIGKNKATEWQMSWCGTLTLTEYENGEERHPHSRMPNHQAK